MNPKLSLLLLGALALTGCQAANHTQHHAVVGTGLGALTGAMIAGESGLAKEGALVGGAIGLVAGSMIGAEEDAIERDIAVSQASYEQHVSQKALTNADLVHMTRAGVSDVVIISAARDQGGRFDLSPAGIIALKNSGVSDDVILSIQHSQPAPPPAVIYAPPPRRDVSYGVSIQTGTPRCRVSPRYHHHPHW